jgi:hypothetical protein
VVRPLRMEGKSIPMSSMVGFLFELRERGDFLNAEVAKVYAESAKKNTKGIQKIQKNL